MKKTLCFILALVMVISMVPMASASDGSESPALVYRFLKYSNGYWVEDTDGTALCPFCGIDSIISESSGFPITKEFLEQMNKRYF